MMAGRMTGAQRMTSLGRANPLPASVKDVAHERIPTEAGAEIATPARPLPQPITVQGYDTGALTPDSVAGRRTSHIQARFTPFPDDAPLSQPSTRQITADSSQRDDSALRRIAESDNARDEAVSQAQLNADNTRDDAALRDMLNKTGQPNPIDTAGLERAGRDLSAAATALKATAQQQHMDRVAAQVAGSMDVSGRQRVRAVVGDAIDMEREYRTQANKPMLEGAGDTFGGRMAQAVGMQPIPGQTPITDSARFNAVGDAALRMGLNGGQVIQVMEAEANAPDGRSVSPELQGALIRQVRTNTGARQAEAQQQVGQFLNLTAALPDEVHISGSIDQNRLKSTEGTS